MLALTAMITNTRNIANLGINKLKIAGAHEPIIVAKMVSPLLQDCTQRTLINLIRSDHFKGQIMKDQPKRNQKEMNLEIDPA